MAALQKLNRNEKGATAIEYGLIAALIAIAAIASMRGLGLRLIGMYSDVANALP